MIKNGEIDLLINTTSHKKAIAESYSIRRTALTFNVLYTTTLAGARATVLAIESMREGELEVKTIQEYHDKIKSTTIPPAGWLGVRGFKNSRVFLPFPEWDNNDLTGDPVKIMLLPIID